MPNIKGILVFKRFCAALLACSTLCAQPPADWEQRLRALEAKIRQLDPTFVPGAGSDFEQRLRALEGKLDALLAPKPSPLPPQTSGLEIVSVRTVGVTSEFARPEESETRLPVSGYMEANFSKPRGEPGEFNFRRFTLLFGHSFSPRIRFWSELEVQNAIVEGGEEKGELELEQAYLDFLIRPSFNLRAGKILTPIGLVNQRHEPPSFNGVERPLVETVIIPSTWSELGFGATGTLGRGFRYQAYVMGGLDATLFTAEEGIREGRQSGFQVNFRNPAKTARVEFAGVPRLNIGASVFTGPAGFALVSVNPRVDVFSFDGRYSYDRFDIRALFANTWVSRAGRLNTALERDFGFNPNIASQMRGYYVEPAVRVLRRRARADVALFTRYEKFNTQHKMPEGYVPLQQWNRSAWFVGATFLPTADVAIKFDYAFHRNASAVVPAINSLNLGLGWWF